MRLERIGSDSTETAEKLQEPSVLTALVFLTPSFYTAAWKLVPANQLPESPSSGSEMGSINLFINISYNKSFSSGSIINGVYDSKHSQRSAATPHHNIYFWRCTLNVRNKLKTFT